MPKTETSVVTIKEAASKFVASMQETGKSPATLYRYGMDTEIVVGFFNGANELSKINAGRVALFIKSDPVNKLKDGKPKAKPTIDRTIRVLRQFFEYCVAQGWIEKAPMPKPKPSSNSQPDEDA